MLLANNINPCYICVLADDLTKPKDIKKTFEESIKDAVNNRLSKMNIPDSIFGVTRLESHSSLLLQIVDILLGVVMYDFKKNEGLISKRLAERQEIVVEAARKTLQVDTFAKNQTHHKPNYFSVWQFSN